ncbi:integral peroxisomal membrane peroxin-domain-containing protein [Pseudomassariella vexata]|uniref:Integral peroxisomal membrane peroxin-domain-containing protein n=1 Tax=Pseudomassariella vexata TaxID=1141098 RepID=A0A1Y2DV31_9PEZI|nr:integral peroxisomal membrane peroxin-domain-containing protein [Pseudomassariella vexata]ORY63049.1 integral peroxisomal membrane peroxin-domain-containing protein [Pseudomassariella vexata]
MDEYTTDVFVNRDDSIPIVRLDGTQSRSSTPANEPPDHSDADSPTPRRKGLRGRLSALKDKASLQDHLVEKLLTQVLADDGRDFPQDDGPRGGSSGSSPNSGGGTGPSTSRPAFSLPTMSTNFRRFNSRIGVVFVFQARVVRLLSWRHPTHTLSFLAVYTFVCLDPYLLPLLPLAILLIGVMIPNFIARHPAASFALSSEQAIGYSPHGPPLAPALTVKPVKELSRDFFRNMRDLQNSMEDFSQLHDGIITLMLPRINFSDEALSSAIFSFLFAGCLVLSIAANVLPWRAIFLVLGWAVTIVGHPAVQKQMEGMHGKHVKPQEDRALGWMEKWIEGDVILDSAPETREVEIFELQRLSGPDGEWEAWVFSASPYDPLSPTRIAGDRPVGTRFFEDVLPPQGWEWSEKKWALDLWSREWVEERIITGVEVETEGERWVYDIFDEKEADRVGVIEENEQLQTPAKGKGTAPPPKPSWEEGEDYEGRRGDWRRRRWVRLVKRKNLGAGKEAIS